MAKTVKMQDIAGRLGVSTMTVSKALSGKSGVSEQTRQKIKQLAAEMGYIAPGTDKEDRRISEREVSGMYIFHGTSDGRRVPLAAQLPCGKHWKRNCGKGRL